MATETTIAPVKKQPKSPFGKAKQPDVIIYELLVKNDRKMRDDTPEYPPYKEFPNVDIILWNFGTEKEPNWGERTIRFLPGFQSIFVDEQEKDGKVIPERTLNNRNNKFIVNKGFIKVPPTQRTKIQFLDMCNRNVDSPYRTGRINALFSKYSEEKAITILADKQSSQQKAIEKAFTASPEQIAFHARYLEIPIINSTTSASRTFEAVQTDYRQKAVDDPDKFLKTFDDEDLKLKYKIERALEENFFSVSLVPGKVVLLSTKEEVCDTAGDLKATAEAIFVHCQTNEELARKIRARE
jgi:hypothetical protein